MASTQPEMRAIDPTALRERVLAAARHEPAPTRRRVRWQTLTWMAAGALATLVVFAASGGVRLGARPPALAWATAFGAFAATVAALQTIVWRRDSMMARRTSHIVLRAGAIVVALSGWKLGWSAAHDAAAPAAEPSALACGALALGLGLPPLAVALALRRRSEPRRPGSMGFALGAVAGLGASMLVDLGCPRGDPGHVLLGHVAPVLLLAALGALIRSTRAGAGPDPAPCWRPGAARAGARADAAGRPHRAPSGRARTAVARAAAASGIALGAASAIGARPSAMAWDGRDMAALRDTRRASCYPEACCTAWTPPTPPPRARAWSTRWPS
ncbi:MAG: NrsF family protein [Myxococcota bacterium]